MEKFNLSISYNGKNKVLLSDLVSELYDFLDTCIHSIPSQEVVHFKHFKFNGCSVDGLFDHYLTRQEVVELKNLLNTDSELDVVKVLGTIHCSENRDILGISHVLEHELPKLKGAYISGSDIKARQMHFEEYKQTVKDEVSKNPLLTVAFDAIDWDLARSHYFAKVRMDYFADAVLFFAKAS